MRILSHRGLRVLGSLEEKRRRRRERPSSKFRSDLRIEVLSVLFTLVVVGCGCADVETVADPAPDTLGGTEGDTEDSGDGARNDSNGETDEGRVCEPGSKVDCYDGLLETKDVSHCHGGTAQCADDGKSLGPCVGQSLPVAESCNLEDDDCDGQTDELESCPVCLRPNPDGTVSKAPWKEHTSYGQQCYSAVIDPRCDDSEYDYALNIPAINDPGWAPHAAVKVDWGMPTNELILGCNAGQGCAGGGQFYYFQTFFFIGTVSALSSARLQVASVDDGVRVTVFNSAYPGGFVVPGGYLCMADAQVTDDFSALLTTGFNRIIMTLLDDCPEWSELRNVEILINGQALSSCSS